jgi:hypothetical protein
MNDRQRLEAIVSVVCKYLPPDGTPINEAMSEIIGLVDPLPPQRTEGRVCCQQYDICLEPCTSRGRHLAQRTWVGLTDDEHCDIWYKESLDWMEYGKAIEAKLKENNT